MKVTTTIVIFIQTFEHANLTYLMTEIVHENFSLTPDGIMETLNLRNVQYKQTAKYGHFGIEDLPWEKLIRQKL